MFIDEDITVKVDGRVVNHYRELGYNVNSGDIITIKTSHLNKGSHKEVILKCDYCGEVYKRKFKDHIKIKQKKKSIDKDACFDCGKKKLMENVTHFYDGVHPSQNLKAKKKRTKTNIVKYGKECTLGNKEIREKARSTIISRYGVDNYFKVENFHEIQRKTMLEKYGYEYYWQDPIKLEESNRKRSQTMYRQGTAPASRQQRYIQDIIGGELNYPFGNLMLDIAFPEEKIYLEFQGSGHDLDVIMGHLTEEEFKRKEINRYYFLKNRNWKMIEVISTNDMLPYPEKIHEMLKLAREVCQESSYIVFNLDDSTVKIQGKYYSYNYGEVITQSKFRKIHEENKYEVFMRSII